MGQAGRDRIKTENFAAPPVGAVREPPGIRALLEAPLPDKFDGP